MYRPEELEIYPTVQCRLQYSLGKHFSEIKQELYSDLFNTELFSNVEVLEDTDEFLLSGKLCTSSKFNITMKNMFGEDFTFQSQQLVITYPQYYMMISFAGPIEGPYVCTEDFMSIMRSIKLRF